MRVSDLIRSIDSDNFDVVLFFSFKFPSFFRYLPVCVYFLFWIVHTNRQIQLIKLYCFNSIGEEKKTLYGWMRMCPFSVTCHKKYPFMEDFLKSPIFLSLCGNRPLNEKVLECWSSLDIGIWFIDAWQTCLLDRVRYYQFLWVCVYKIKSNKKRESKLDSDLIKANWHP